MRRDDYITIPSAALEVSHSCPTCGTAGQPTLVPGGIERALHRLLHLARGVPDAWVWTTFACQECCRPRHFGCSYEHGGGL